jgi:hypothetical protein
MNYFQTFTYKIQAIHDKNVCNTDPSIAYLFVPPRGSCSSGYFSIFEHLGRTDLFHSIVRSINIGIRNKQKQFIPRFKNCFGKFPTLCDW